MTSPPACRPPPLHKWRWGKTPAAAGVIDLAKGMLSPQMLELLSFKGTIVTIDAMGTQTEIASIIS